MLTDNVSAFGSHQMTTIISQPYYVAYESGADLEETIWVGPQIRGSGDMLSKEIWNFAFSQSIWGVILMLLTSI